MKLYMDYYYVGSTNFSVELNQTDNGVALVSNYGEVMFDSDNAVAIAQFILDLSRGAYAEYSPSWYVRHPEDKPA